MAAGIASPSSARRGRRRRPIMSEINVTPFVDVMLALLIVFMVSAPLLTRGVPVHLSHTEAKPLAQKAQSVLAVTISADGQIYLQNDQVPSDEALVKELKAATEARGQPGEPIYYKGDSALSYTKVQHLLGLLSGAGFDNVVLVTE